MISLGSRSWGLFRLPLIAHRSLVTAHLLVLLAWMISEPAWVLAQERPAEREMSTDRPDKTESPYTVPTRRWQLEVDALNYSRDVVSGVVDHSLEIVSTNLKYGLHSRADIQLILVPLHYQIGGGTEVGDVSGRLKLNLAGNDGGRLAIGVMPFINLVRGATGREVEGGLIVPLAVTLAPGWDLGTMLEADLVRVEGLTGRHPVLVHSFTVGHDFGAGVGAYAELFNQLTPARASDRVRSTFDLGVTWRVLPEVQLDAGLNLGLNPAAEDLNPFLGFSIRF
jgi:hypothetical protein